jgi:hypothetical protein
VPTNDTKLQGVDSDDAKADATSIDTALQFLYVGLEHTKNMLDDYGLFM